MSPKYRKFAIAQLIQVFNLASLAVAIPAFAANAGDSPPETPAQAGAEADFWTREGVTGDWLGARKQLENHGLSIDARITTEASKVLSGGVNTERFSAQYLLNLSLTLNLEKSVGLPGGEAFVNFQHFGGRDPGKDVGDAGGISSLTGGERTQLSEVWYKQALMPGHDILWFKLGKIDANSDFAYLESAAEFLNNGMGLALSDALLPTYPDPAFGAELFLTPLPWLYAGGGIFDGSLAESKRTGLLGPKHLIASPADLYMIGEIGAKWDIRGHAGTVKTGLRYNTGTFARLDGGRQSGSAGGYVLAEQQIWKWESQEKDQFRGVCVFGGFDWSDENISIFSNHYNFGISLTGPFDFRPKDMVGVGFSSARLSRAAGAEFNREHEQAIETFYRVQVTPWLSVKPDLQYVINPGGQADVSDALVATVRVEIVF